MNLNVRLSCAGISIGIVLGILFGCTRSTKAYPLISTDSTIIEEFRQFLKQPLSVSPSGTWIVTAGPMKALPFGLTILSRDEQIIAKSFGSREPIMRVTWRPDSGALAYFKQISSTARELYVWNLSDNVHSLEKIPVSYNQYQVTWAPDGRALAFTSDEDKIVFCTPGTEPIVYHQGARAFDWSRDSTKICAILEGEAIGSSVVVINSSNGKELDRIEIARDYQLVSVDWSADRPVLRAQRKKENLSILVELDLDSRTIVSEHNIVGEVSQPRRIPGSTLYAWTTQNRGRDRNLIIGTISGAEVWRYAPEGIVNFRGFSSNGQKLYASLVSPKANKIIEIPAAPASNTAPVEVASAPGIQLDEVCFEQWHLEESGVNVSVELARRRNGKSGGSERIVIRMLGGDSPQHLANWAERQFYLNRGISYALLPNIKPAGPKHLIRLCNEIVRRLRISRLDIAVLGESTAASVVLEGLAQKPDLCGVVGVVGLTRKIGFAKGNLPEQSATIVACHGSEDPFPPSFAKRLLITAFGESALVPPRGVWHVFPGEPHSLNLSSGNFHATILSYFIDHRRSL